MVVAGLSIFNACEKSDELIDQSVDAKSKESIANPMFAGLDTIAFSVENNRLVFDSEEEYQKCIDFLGTIDVEDYNLFEKEIGFNSLLSTSIFANQPCPIDDEIFATLLNPEMEIIVGHFLFTLNNKEEKVNALFIGEDCDLKSVNSSVQEFSYDDDVFAILNREKALKSTAGYCGAEDHEDHLYNFIYNRIDYNKYGIYNNVVIRLWNSLGSQYTLNYLRIKTVDSPLDQVPSGITSRCFYKRDGKQNETIYSQTQSNTWEIKKTIWRNTRRLVGFRYDIEFSWKLNSWDALSYNRVMIECHQY